MANVTLAELRYTVIGIRVSWGDLGELASVCQAV